MAASSQQSPARPGGLSDAPQLPGVQGTGQGCRVSLALPVLLEPGSGGLRKGSGPGLTWLQDLLSWAANLLCLVYKPSLFPVTLILSWVSWRGEEGPRSSVPPVTTSSGRPRGSSVPQHHESPLPPASWGQPCMWLGRTLVPLTRYPGWEGSDLGSGVKTCPYICAPLKDGAHLLSRVRAGFSQTEQRDV